MLADKDKGLKGVSAGDPSIIGAYALKVTYEILDGKAPPAKNISVKAPIVTTADLKDGVNVFPDLPPTLDAVSDAAIARYFVTLGAKELMLDCQFGTQIGPELSQPR